MALQSTADKRTPAEIQAQLDARADDIRRRIAELRHELTSAAEFSAAGQPALDRVRAHPLESVGAAAAAGLVVGLVTGLAGWARARRRVRKGTSEGQAARLLLASLLDDAAHAVAGGKRPDVALRDVAKRRGPLVMYAPQPTPAKGALREQLDLALKTALGFGAKTAMDLLAKKLTGRPEVFHAAAKAAEGAPPVTPEAGADGA